jgi:hypothetical protein
MEYQSGQNINENYQADLDELALSCLECDDGHLAGESVDLLH